MTFGSPFGNLSGHRRRMGSKDLALPCLDPPSSCAHDAISITMPSFGEHITVTVNLPPRMPYKRTFSYKASSAANWLVFCSLHHRSFSSNWPILPAAIIREHWGHIALDAAWPWRGRGRGRGRGRDGALVAGVGVGRSVRDEIQRVEVGRCRRAPAAQRRLAPVSGRSIRTPRHDSGTPTE